MILANKQLVKLPGLETNAACLGYYATLQYYTRIEGKSNWESPWERARAEPIASTGRWRLGRLAGIPTLYSGTTFS